MNCVYDSESLTLPVGMTRGAKAAVSDISSIESTRSCRVNEPVAVLLQPEKQA